MSVDQLLSDLRRANAAAKHTRRRRHKEKKEDFIKRKNKYRCTYCLRKRSRKDLTSSLEPYHMFRKGDSLNRIQNHYNISYKQLKDLNPDINLNGRLEGVFLTLEGNHNIYPNTHGVCSCTRCHADKMKLGLGHAEYSNYILKLRKHNRNGLDKDLKKSIKESYGDDCHYCIIEFGNDQGRKKNFDHKNPIVRGGKSTKKNVARSCIKHNLEKGNMSYERYTRILKERKKLK